jgi:hypothetical protein
MTREQHGGRWDEIRISSAVVPLLPPRSSLDRWAEGRGIESGEAGRRGGEPLVRVGAALRWLERRTLEL